jgi:hypothetical protein
MEETESKLEKEAKTFSEESIRAVLVILCIAAVCYFARMWM